MPGPGTILGQFQLAEELGRGSYGAVFRAKQKRLRRQAAVKVFFPKPTDEDPEVIAKRFVREVDLVRRLEHPNIVRLYDFGRTQEGALWMATELVRGVTLLDVILGEGPMRPERARNIMLQVLSGLAMAHDLDIVHRDIKPGNVMLSEVGADSDHVKLLDFGIGKAMGDMENPKLQRLTNAEAFMHGTPLYMAPEQVKGEDVGPFTDIYATGCVLFEMLTGHPPYDGDSPFQVVANKLSKAVVYPDWLSNTRMRALIERAMSINPIARFQDARTFHRALKAAPLPGQQYTPGVDPRRDPATGPGFQDTEQARATPMAKAPSPSSLALAETTTAAVSQQTNKDHVPLVVVPESAGERRSMQLPPWLTGGFMRWAIGLIAFALIMWIWMSLSSDNIKNSQEAMSNFNEEPPYERGENVSPIYLLEPDEASELCDDGDQEACVTLGKAYASGMGVQVDEVYAAELFQEACDENEPSGCGNLAALMAEGRGVEHDPAGAAELFDEACRYGHMASCYNLGMLYREGVGVDADETLAVRLMTRACNGGISDACDSI